TASSLHDPPTPATYTLSLHDALPICHLRLLADGEEIGRDAPGDAAAATRHAHDDDGDDHQREQQYGHVQQDGSGQHVRGDRQSEDRKSTRLNSSHVKISYAVFCLKKK